MFENSISRGAKSSGVAPVEINPKNFKKPRIQYVGRVIDVVSGLKTWECERNFRKKSWKKWKKWKKLNFPIIGPWNLNRFFFQKTAIFLCINFGWHFGWKKRVKSVTFCDYLKVDLSDVDRKIDFQKNPWKKRVKFVTFCDYLKSDLSHMDNFFDFVPICRASKNIFWTGICLFKIEKQYKVRTYANNKRKLKFTNSSKIENHFT